jgi:hypothetical protein
MGQKLMEFLNLCTLHCTMYNAHLHPIITVQKQNDDNLPWTLSSLHGLHFGVYGSWTGQLIVTASRADQSGHFYLCCGLGAWPESLHDQRKVERLDN